MLRNSNNYGDETTALFMLSLVRQKGILAQTLTFLAPSWNSGPKNGEMN